jgi:pyridoxamine 5'-phosphate oxidase
MGSNFDELSARIARLEATRYESAERSLGDDEGLSQADLDPDPFRQFGVWLVDALAAHPGWPNAMTLATADADGEPSARTVLLKGVDERGFTFFTNHGSRKGRDLASDPRAALVFYWASMARQVCVRGAVSPVSRAESAGYFASRPYGSRIGAWASAQSSPIESREALEGRARAFEERFGENVPLPDHWGGFRLAPNAFEFWKGRKNRLHDRFLYKLEQEGWGITRLAP